MRVSNLLIPTLRDAPADAEIISHQLMLRAGMIRKQASGIYTWLPLGLRVLRKIEQIIREEMDNAGAQELLMSGVQPAELWQESGRWEQYGPELLRIQDRHQRDFCLGPTHEEIITDLIRREVRSYRQLPANFYQIQTKFRDEPRPKSGLLRVREFAMKDSYSFHLNDASLAETYQQMYETYSRIFTRIGLHFRAVEADSGNIGGSASHEFHVLASSGEDCIAFSNSSDYAANVELAPTAADLNSRPAPAQQMAVVDTPNQHSIEEVSAFLQIDSSQCVKTLIVNGPDETLVALVLRGDHELNAVKAEKLEAVDTPLSFADAAVVKQKIGCEVGSLGPKDLDIPVIVDHAAAVLADFVCGANKDGQHLTGVNWQRDLDEPQTADLRNVVAGDPSPDGEGELELARGIEVGHIFQLGDKYSAAMKATCLDENGKSVTLTMGCYGIGVSRLVAAAIEQNHDERGIIWPTSIAPFQLVIVPINMHKSERLREAVDSFYADCKTAGIDVLVDDRKERPGVMFTDMELIGIPHRLVLSDRGLDNNTAEYRGRTDEASQDIALDAALSFIKERLEA